MLPSEIANQRVELATFVDRNNYRDTGSFTNALVVFTIGRCLVNDAGSITLTNVVIYQNLPGGFGSKTLGVGVVVEDALVLESAKFRSLYGLRNCSHRIVSVFKTKLFGVISNQRFC